MAGRFARLRRERDDDPSPTEATEVLPAPEGDTPGGDAAQPATEATAADAPPAGDAAAASTPPVDDTPGGDAAQPATDADATPAGEATGASTPPGEEGAPTTELVVVDGTTPAEQEPEAEPAPEGPPGFIARGRLRRRLRYVRRAREFALRDLGGLVFDLHRFERDRGDLVEQKLAGLSALDAEMRALEAALDARLDVTVLREPGLATCPRCGALSGSDASYCSSCGLPLDRGAGLPAGPTTSGAAPVDPQQQHPASPPAADEPPTPVP